VVLPKDNEVIKGMLNTKARAETPTGNATKEEAKKKDDTDKLTQAMKKLNINLPWWSWMVIGIMATAVSFWMAAVCLACLRGQRRPARQDSEETLVAERESCW